VRELFPCCPAGREIAEHACLKYSGRVGRSAAMRRLEEDAVHIAVAAHVRRCDFTLSDIFYPYQGAQNARCSARTGWSLLLPHGTSRPGDGKVH
jgi:hypothetical protein